VSGFPLLFLSGQNVVPTLPASLHPLFPASLHPFLRCPIMSFLFSYYSDLVDNLRYVRELIVMLSEPTSNLYDSISRTVRGVSSALPRGLPTPPIVSRPMSFGSFFGGQAEEPGVPSSPAAAPPIAVPRMTPSTASPTHGPLDRQGAYPRSPPSRPLDARNRRRSSAASTHATVVRRRGMDEVTTLDLDDGASTGSRDDATRYGGGSRARGEDVVFATWDMLVDGSASR
jgi:hypothetical protein